MSRLNFQAPISGTTSTSSNTTVTLATFDFTSNPTGLVLDNVGVLVQGYICAQSGTNVATAFISRSFKRMSGTVSAVNSLTSIVAGTAGALIGDVALVTAVGNISNSGNTIILQCTGIIATNITWSGYLTIYTGEF